MGFFSYLSPLKMEEIRKEESNSTTDPITRSKGRKYIYM